MPLKVRIRKDTGSLEIYGVVRPAGTGQAFRVRHRAGTNDPRLAAEEAAALEARLLRDAHLGERRATKSFAEAALSYLKHQPRTPGTQVLVRRLTLHFRDTPLGKIDQEAVDEARDKLLRKDAGPGTVRRGLIVPLRAILIHAAKRKWCERPEFDIPREPTGRTAFLMPAQVEALIGAAPPHLQPLVTYLACTGCRLGEALQLDWPEVDLQGARVILWEGETKGGARRVVNLPPRAIMALAGLKHREGRVFRDRKGEAYRLSGDDGQSGGQIRTSWASACVKAGLPGELRAYPKQKQKVFMPAYTPHSLRHTWATWHYALHRDLLLLKTEGGWSSTSLVERYAHLMPAGYEEAIRAVWGVGAAAATARA